MAKGKSKSEEEKIPPHGEGFPQEHNEETPSPEETETPADSSEEETTADEETKVWTAEELAAAEQAHKTTMR